MGKYKEMVHTLPEEKSIMEELTDMTDTFIESIKTTHPQKYSSFIQQLKDLTTSYHFDEDLLKEAWNYVGSNISVVDSERLAEDSMEVDFSKEPFNKWDFNYAMNLMYYYFHNVYGDEMIRYGELALSWLDCICGKAKAHFEKTFLTE